MNGDARIHPILTEDIEQAARLIANTITERYDPGIYPYLIERFGQGFVGLFEPPDILAGVLIAVPEGDDTLRVLVLAVTPGSRGMGIGKALMGYIERLARDRSHSRVTLEVRTLNRGGLAFYTELDYRITGYLEAFYSDGTNAFSMARQL